MTFLDDPTDERYADEAEVRLEFSRVAGACADCRHCIDLCGAFPALFDIVDRIDDRDTGRMTPEEQDGVADACFHCGDCLAGCAVGGDEVGDAGGPIDVPRAMLRLEAVRHAARRRTTRDRVATSILARPSIDRALVGTSKPGSVRRRLIASATGRSASSPALDRRVTDGPSAATTSAVLVTGCTHNSFDRRVVADAVALYTHLGMSCEVVDLGTCGAVALQAGEAERVRRIAERNIARLDGAGTGAATAQLVVLDPVCRWMIVDEYARHLSGERDTAARAVAARATDLAGHVSALFDDAPALSLPSTIVLHSDARTLATGETEAVRRLLSRTATRVEVIDGSSAGGTVCAQRAIKDRAVAETTDRFVARVGASAGRGAAIVSSCGATGALLTERTGLRVVHPATLLARAVAAVD